MRMHITDQTSELENRIAGPGGATFKLELVQSLAATEMRLRQRLQAGVPREQFAAARALADAAQAARHVLDLPHATAGGTH